MKETQLRGQLTQQVKDLTKQLFGKEFTVTQLRLLPYIQFLAVNHQCIDIAKVSANEIACLNEWHNAGYIVSEIDMPMKPSNDFWTKLNQVLWMSYIDIVL